MAEPFISLGYQFEVTDQGETFYKRLLTPDEAEARFRSYGRGSLFFVDFAKIAGDAVEDAVTSLEGVRELLQDYPEIGPTLANPVIEANGNYSQDKVLTFGGALRRESARGGRRLIDEYIDLSLRHVSYGFMEKVFKVTANCGVDANDNVVLIDLGALTFDKDEAVRLAATKRWQKSEAFFWPLPGPKDFALPAQLRPYFYKRMRSQFTADSVGSAWGESRRSDGQLPHPTQ